MPSQNKNTEKAILDQVNRATKHVSQYGVTDVELMPELFEVPLLRKQGRDNWQTLVEEISQNITKALNKEKKGKVRLEQLQLQPLQHVLIPKKTIADFRKCSLADIKDEITYLSLVLLIARKIEADRISKQKDRVYSYRFDGTPENDKLFHEEYSFTSFGRKVLEKSKRSSTKVRIDCDIASFYDRLNLHRLNSILLSIKGTDSDVIQLLDELLLFWQDRNSYGLPVGSNGSRILAEAALIEVDRQLAKEGVDFIRFVDDYRIFANNASIANKHLALLVKLLEREGLFLNSSKTRIVDVSETYVLDTDTSQGSPEMEASDENLTSVQEATHLQFENSQNTAPKSRYAGLIPLKFRNPSESEKEFLQLLNIRYEISQLKRATILDEKTFRNICSGMATQGKFSYSSSLVKLTSKCPQFTPYTVSFLIKHSDHIPENEISNIVEFYRAQLHSRSTPEFILLSIARLFSNKKFANYNDLFDAYLNLERGYGGILGRAYLAAMTGGLDRAQILKIRDHARNMTLFECRGIAHLVTQGLHPSEGDPFLKNLSLQYNDYFLRNMKGSITK
ncbi:RNA-directed DNA polymerase [Corynebacterium sp. H130]|uniref:RNA-directed DNA polymerase n=1 Tax=Corynebacterium sp. H130 TaxID=3133444 RepID=UPI0030AC7D66